VVSPRVVDVYPYRVTDRGVEWLLLRRSEAVLYAGTWRMVGGKVRAGETAWQAALRELGEETGLQPTVFWTLPTVNTFYEWEEDRITLAPAFAAELREDPVLDREHDSFEWLPIEEASERLEWPEQRRLIRLADAILGAAGGPPAELVVTDHSAR